MLRHCAGLCVFRVDDTATFKRQLTLLDDIEHSDLDFHAAWRAFESALLHRSTYKKFGHENVFPNRSDSGFIGIDGNPHSAGRLRLHEFNRSPGSPDKS